MALASINSTAIEANIEKAELVSRKRTGVVLNAEIRRTKARLMEEVPKLQGLAFKKAFMLKKATEEPLGRAASIVADILENAKSNGVITAAQKWALLQEMALRLS